MTRASDCTNLSDGPKVWVARGLVMALGHVIGYALMVSLLMGCTGMNKSAKEGILRYSGVISISGKYVVDGDLIDGKSIGKRADGTIDMDKCIKAEKMRDLFIQGYPLMADSLKKWAKGEDVVVPPRVTVDYKARCK